VAGRGQVIECAWDELQRAMRTEVKDFDGLIGAHAAYVANLTTRAFLDAPSKVHARARE
jgi:hypothetical protein